MPVIGISVKQLTSLLGRDIDLEELTDILEQLGCDVDGVGASCFYECPQCQLFVEKQEHEEAPKRCTSCGYESESVFAESGKEQMIRLDLLPARPDLFDAGGLARALKGYLDIETGLIEINTAKPNITVEVSEELSKEDSYRPYIACAEVEIPPLESDTLRMIMKLQENLHWGIGRDRKLASIGVYNLETIKQPIEYKAASPDFAFCPLGNPNEKMTLQQILETHPKGQAYAHLLENHKKYPLLVDSAGQVLSMPPIINSEETRVKLGTSKLFIDVTGITAADVHKSLNTLVCSLRELGGKVTGVTIKNPTEEKVTPDLAAKTITINIEAARKWLGLNISIPDLVHYLERMRFNAVGRFPKYHISYPAFRTDIKHEVDVFEDLAIAYGYRNMALQMVPTMTVANARPEEIISAQTRQIMLGLGFVEIMSLMLTTEANHFSKLRLSKNGQAIIQNPKSAEHNIVRCHLMTGILESLVKNRRKHMPQQYFELGNVVHLETSNKSDTGTWEERRLGFAIIGPDVGYANIRAILDAVLAELGLEGQHHTLEHSSFISGRCAKVEIEGEHSATLGEIHPEVLNNFGLNYPVALAELSLAKLFVDSEN